MYKININSWKILVFLILVVTVTGCEEPIEIDLKEAEPSLVVEALVTDSVAPFQVKLTTTKDFFSAAPAPVVTNAFVTIADDAGNLDTLKYITNGIYQTLSLKQGVVNRTYTLTIKHNNKSFSAASMLRPPFMLDSIDYTFVKGNPLQKRGYYLSFHGKDREEPGDYFLVRVYRNDTMQIFPVKYLSDGDQFLEPGKPIHAQMPYQFNLKDTASVEFLSITKEYYQYLFNLNNQLQSGGTPFDAQPANLPTNLTGGAHGYFVVASISKRKFVIK